MDLKEIERKENFLFKRLGEIRALENKVKEEEMEKLKQMLQGDDLWNIIAINFLSSEPVDVCELKRKLDITKKDLLQKKIMSVIASSGSYEEAILSVINALSKL